jgi:hypothetical protein
MRLALLGPADGHADALEAAAQAVLTRHPVDRAVYLGVDGALDGVVQRIAVRLVGENPSEEGIWARAARACLRASPGELDTYIGAERARAELRSFESLPDADTRAVEMLGGALLLMIHDKSDLNEEDLIPARVLLFGKSRSPIVKQVGQRWFLSPGSFPDAGVLILEDGDDGIRLQLLDSKFEIARTEQLSTNRATKLKVGADAG